MLAETNYTGIAIIALGALLVLVSIGALALRNRVRGRGAEIPAAMRPGPSDAALEAPLFHKLQGWGVVLLAFFVVWFPITWLLEPATNESQDQELLDLAHERGALAVELFSEENQLGVGCVRCHGPELRGGTVIQNGTDPETGEPRYGYPANLTDVCGRLTPDEIRQVIEEGRIEQGMPSWSIKFAGALDDQQITDLINYLISINKKTVPFDQNKCLNPELASTATPAAAASPTEGSQG